VEQELWGHWRAMVRAARRVVGSIEDAQDCAAEALTQFLERRPADVENLEAFLVTVAHRRAVDHVRAGARARAREERAGRELAVLVPDVAEDVAARAEASWVAAEARHQLQPRAYTLMQMVADGLPVPEIAAQLGIHPHAVEARLMRARRTLRAVVARSLAALGLALGAVRRWVTPAAASTAVVAAALVIGLLEQPRPLAAVPPTYAPVLVRPVSAADITGAEVRSQVGRGESRTSAPRGRVGPPEGSVVTPVGSIGLELHDDENRSRTPVEQLQRCLDNLRVTLGYQGCESSPSG
jgi:RNA polymerase sigma factor (sigma-70 family)